MIYDSLAVGPVRNTAGFADSLTPKSKLLAWILAWNLLWTALMENVPLAMRRTAERVKGRMMDSISLDQD
jgi:hypothetical protein